MVHSHHFEDGYICFPDEKGTESFISKYACVRRLCYICFPDEKGTERFRVGGIEYHDAQVTFVSPMKRGLKVQEEDWDRAADESYICFPDEKGTESPKAKR